ncbi:hypothetical protein GDO81_014820 [Engystomops pustulosus]|uniref:Ig-like domain-containing protein n=1 Tax=Engystomops pustulosus TaxID=76066 RepID=A0AAV7AJ80_ENGPU|nr:hypothetical protein GDO81_014820 [Engystomops pustulosus]
MRNCLGYCDYTVHKAQLTDSGLYHCKYVEYFPFFSVLKDSCVQPIHVQMLFSPPQMTVTPYPVVEGDSLTLTCDTQLNPLRWMTYLEFTFYKYNQKIQELSSFKEYKVQSVELGDSGTYDCAVSTTNDVRKHSPAYFLQVLELFSTPELLVPSYPVVEGEPLSLSCDTSLSPHRGNTNLEYAFYKGGSRIQTPSASKKYEVSVAHLDDSGIYQCEVSSSNNVKKPSREKYIQIQELFSTPQLVVPPYPIVEGDPLSLSCDTTLSPHRRNTNLQFAFYKSGSRIQRPSSSKKYEVIVVDLDDSGSYECEVSSSNNVKKQSEKKYIQVQELFSTPNMKVNSYPVVEGNIMTLTCDTNLSPYRKTTDLWFAFYRNGKIIQELGSSKKYELKVSRLDHSGSYKCEVSTSKGVKKTSQIEYIHIEELFSTPTILVAPYPVVEGDTITLACKTSLSPHIRAGDLQFAFYKEDVKVQEPSTSDLYKILRIQQEHYGEYMCEISTTQGLKKQSQKQSITAQVLFYNPIMAVSPNPVIEGDLMTLTCDISLNPNRKTTDLRFAFNRNGKKVRRASLSKTYELSMALLEHSGKYTCEVSLRKSLKKLSQEQNIWIQELFSTPKMEINRYPVVEGDNLTLTCDTSLNQHRKTTVLKFTFYRNGKIIRESGSAKEFELKVSHLGHAGIYKCGVNTNNGVNKTSQEKYIQIQELFSTPKILVIPYPVVEGDNMTLACNTSVSPHVKTSDLKFAFYKGDKEVQEPSSSELYKILRIQQEHSGDYKCEITTAQGLKKSSQKQDIIVQELFSTPKILVTPYPVVEGDNMTLACQTSLSPHIKSTDLQFAFYKGDKEVQVPSSSDLFRVLQIQQENSGDYMCEISTTQGLTKSSQKQDIIVQELYAPPKIATNSNPLVEGAHMSLTCDTSLSPQRSSGNLRFAFYQNGKKVQDFESLNTYEIPAIKYGNSGDYSCEVLATNNMTKNSLKTFIEVEELFLHPEIKMASSRVTEGDHMSLKCDTVPLRNLTELEFAFYRDGKNIQDFSPSDTYDVQSAGLEDSGNYTCTVKILEGNVVKRSHKFPVHINED